MSRRFGRVVAFAAAIVLASVSLSAIRANAPAAVATSQLNRNFGHVPMSFEPNVGQVDKSARYISRGHGSTLFLTPDSAMIVVSHVPQTRRRPAISTAHELKPDSDMAKQIKSSALRIMFENASPKVVVEGESRLAGTSNYFMGKDAGKWRTRIPTFAKVRYRSLYPGIDLVFYGTEGHLEYDLIVAPGADPNRVRFAFDGASKLELDAAGDLEANVGSDKIVIHKPAIYQQARTTRKPINGGFRRFAHDRIGVEVAAYDKSSPLIIDPTVTYSSYLSGTGFDLVNWSAIDAAGDQYLTGLSCSSDFPETTGAYQKTNAGGCDAFVTELNPSGTELIYSTFLGGDLFDEGNGIAVDGSGAAYIVGETAGDFPTTSNAFQQTDPGLPVEGFVAKLSSDGSQLVYSSYLGGTAVPIAGEQDRAFGVAVPQQCTSDCDAYIVGQTSTCDFPTAGSPVQPQNAGYSMTGAGCAASLTNNPFDGYVTEFKPDGSGLIYSTYLGGKGGDATIAIAVDSTGQAYVTGSGDAYAGPENLPTSSGAAQPNFGGTTDAFAVKLSASGSQMVYSTFLGGSGYDQSQDIAIDSSGDAYVSGYTYSIDFPTFGSNVVEATAPSYLSGWLTKLNPSGGFAFSTYLGNLSSQPSERVALDSANNVYVAGWTNLPTGYPTVSPVQSTPAAAGVVLQSMDGGNTFNNSGFPLNVGSTGSHDIVVDISTTPHTVYVGTIRSGLFVSTDDGGSFAPTSFTGFVSAEYLDTNTSSPTLFFGSPAGLYKVTGQGQNISLTSITAPVALLGVDTTVNPSAIYAWAGGNQIQVSTDGGASFPTTIAMPMGTDPYSIARDPNTTTNTLYLGSNRGVLASINGAPFVQTNMNFSPAYQVIVDYNANPSIVYAGAITQGIVWSTDGFSSPVNFPLNVFFGNAQALDLDRTTNPATLYAGTANGVFISSDGGNTFANTGLGNDNPDINSIAIDPGSSNGIFASLFLDTTASVAEISSDGSQLLFSSLFGGSETGLDLGLDVATNGSIYLAGGTYAHDFPTTARAFQKMSSAQLSGFAANISTIVTPDGANRTAAPNGGTTITFSKVSSPGVTTATTSSTNPNPPAGYAPVSQYTDITTTASTTGTITVCLNYNPGQVFNASKLTLLHFVINGWVNVTTGNNTQQGIICGNVTSLSPFVIAQQLEPITLKDCKTPTWKTWEDPSFKNQGQCISFIVNEQVCGELKRDGLTEIERVLHCN
jgi:hypothetical protein